MHYIIKPEVAGGIGPASVFDRSKMPNEVIRLNYEFDGWAGDDLVKTVQIYIATENLFKDLEDRGFSGLRSDEVLITKSGEFLDVMGDIELPPFVWLRFAGKPGVDDFGMWKNVHLVVSQRAMDVLRNHRVEEMTWSEFRPEGE